MVATAARLTSLPPGPTRAPVVQAAEWVRRPLVLLEECERRYGDAFTLRWPGQPPMVLVSDPDAVREVFTGDPEILRAGEANALLRAALGPRSLLLLDGGEHLRERKLMLPPFHGERMRGYGELITGVAERELARWPSDRPFAVAASMRAIALEVITRAVFGVEEAGRRAHLERALRRLLDATTRPLRVLVLMLLDPEGPTVETWRRRAPTIRSVDALLLDEIRRRRADPDVGARTDILSLLVQARDEHGRPLDDHHLRDELLTLLVAGHETTATALAWGIERLARHPGALERLQREDAADGEAYLEAVTKEILRVRTVLPFVVRHVAAPVQVGGRELPAGVRVAPCVHLVHRRADLYPDPEAFRPERFLERPASTYGWIPFGGGTRRCLGGAFAVFEMKTVLRAIARAGSVLPAGAPPGKAGWSAAGERVGRRGLTLVPARGGRILWSPAPAHSA